MKLTTNYADVQLNMMTAIISSNRKCKDFISDGVFENEG